MRRWRLWLVVLVSVALAAGSLQASAVAPETEYDQVQRELERTRRNIAKAEARERELREGIAATSSQRRALQAEIDSLSAELAAVQREVAALQAEHDEVDARLQERARELETLVQRLNAAGEAVRERAVQVYMTGPASLFDFLFTARDFSDLVTRVHYLSGVFAYDDARIRALSSQREQVSEQVRGIEALKHLAAAKLELVAVRRNQVASLKRAIDAKQRALDRTLASQRDSLSQVQQTKAEYLRQQRALEQESRRIAALLSGRTGGSATAGKGEMTWPTSGPVTSPYGYRTHPIHGDTRMHEGIDIGAPSGQPVVASATGVVVHAGPKGGYGNAVIVDHGGGLATVYAHLSVVQTREGGRLGEGMQLGKVGCTGSCTGPHLHFEVRQNGQPQNPVLWLE